MTRWPISVAVGATCLLTGTYTVTAANVTAGSISNTGTGDSNETGPEARKRVVPCQTVYHGRRRSIKRRSKTWPQHQKKNKKY